MFMEAKEFLSHVLDMLSHLDEEMTMHELICVIDRLYMEELRK